MNKGISKGSTADKKRGRGRPRTASPGKRRLDNAERQRRFRARQKIKSLAVKNLTSSPLNTDWLDLLRHLNGQPTSTVLATVQYRKSDTMAGGYRGEYSWPEVESLLLDNTIIDFNFE